MHRHSSCGNIGYSRMLFIFQWHIDWLKTTYFNSKIVMEDLFLSQLLAIHLLTRCTSYDLTHSIARIDVDSLEGLAITEQ
ncbi:MAG: hypothetical protein AAFO69_09870 [Bacteroidota bacterium]